jgi:hypothetical protein
MRHSADFHCEVLEEATRPALASTTRLSRLRRKG